MPDAAPPDPSEAPNLREGTVTRVAQQQRDPERVSVFIDEAFAFGIAYALAVEAGLRKGVRLTVPEQEALLDKQQAHAAYAAALHLIAHQARTVAEVRRALARKGYAEATAEDTVARLEAQGYLDDAAYAKAYVRGRFSGRGHGPARLRQDLSARGVPRALVDAALAELEAEEDLGAAAARHAHARWRALAGEADPQKRRKKTLDFLLRRGHAFDVAREAVERAAAEAGEEDEAGEAFGEG